MTDNMISDPHAVIATEKFRRSRGLWRALAFVALAVAVIIGLGRFALPDGEGAGYVARLRIDGTIATDPARLAAIEALAEDDAVKAVIVAINSPGGTTAGGEELYEALGRLRAAKPTVAVIAELGASAAYFALPFDRLAIEALLDAQAFTAPMRVRLTLDASGPALTAVPLPANPELFRFAIADTVLDSQSLWLAHKTTNRAFYDAPRQRAQAAYGVDEVVFCNERGELTEGSITNLFVERDGRLLTPALSSGLLPGTLRAQLLATGQAEEAALTLADLGRAEAVWLGNSVRGLLPAQWVLP